MFTTFAGLSFTRYGSYYGDYLGLAAIASALVTMISLVMFQVRPKKHELWSALVIAASVSYWASLLMGLGSYWGLIWGLSGPVYTLVGGVLGFVSRPVAQASTSDETG